MENIVEMLEKKIMEPIQAGGFTTATPTAAKSLSGTAGDVPLPAKTSTNDVPIFAAKSLSGTAGDVTLPEKTSTSVIPLAAKASTIAASKSITRSACAILSNGETSHPSKKEDGNTELHDVLLSQEMDFDLEMDPEDALLAKALNKISQSSFVADYDPTQSEDADRPLIHVSENDWESVEEWSRTREDLLVGPLVYNIEVANRLMNKRLWLRTPEMDGIMYLF
ncbi:uncharacterized protein LOC18021944 [Eutrema salsugineum]|uniref:uncharacterized protein LOC18021944 n=1 Tax=Eutrema salsugineum TaxID=72664 RepID=UPI000CED7C9F|nr:uncharacterized protein LOC18021944 [Eutrema salsugineum]